MTIYRKRKSAPSPGSLNTPDSTEKHLIRLMREAGIKGWRRNYPLFGKPDLVFPKQRVAVFVDGEFWHGQPTRAKIQETNVDCWRDKIRRIRRRDRLVNKTLREKGWKVVQKLFQLVHVFSFVGPEFIPMKTGLAGAAQL